MKNYIYVWDLTSGINDNYIYKVEYIGKSGNISYEKRDIAINKARYTAYKLNGNRKCFLLSNDGFYPYSGCCKKIIDVPINTPQLKKWIGKKHQPIASIDYGDEWEYEMFLENLYEKMGGNTYFKIIGKNLDWLGNNGIKYVKVDTADELIGKLYNEDIIYLYNGKRKNEFMMDIPSHDCPTGSHYYIKPISEKTYYKFNYE